LCHVAQGGDTTVLALLDTFSNFEGSFAVHFDHVNESLEVKEALQTK